MSTINDVYMLTDKQSYNVVDPIENVYFYRNLTVTGSASDLALAFIGQMLPSIVPAQFTAISHTSIVVLNLFDASDFHTEVISVPGTLDPTSDALPPHSTFSFNLFPGSKVVRPGRKSYSGATEVSQNNGVIDGAVALTALEVLRVALKLILKDALEVLGDHYTHIILKRIREGVPPNATYRLPVNQGESTPVDILSVDFSPNIETQNSRKLSRI